MLYFARRSINNIGTMIKENIYGHFNRLQWIISHINKEDIIVEFGCGTGYMISLPLAKLGYTIFGVDLDKESITFGQELFRKERLNPDILKAMDISDLNVVPDVIIASEVLEHISSENLDYVITRLYSKLKPGSILLVTVPNGYGWFELESFLWNRLLLGRLLEVLKITLVVGLLKQLLFGKYVDAPYPSTLSSSPHLQRFTLNNIQKKLQEHGFQIIESRGSVLFCGPFSNLLFTGIRPIMRLNIWLGSKLPKIASAFYIVARKK